MFYLISFFTIQRPWDARLSNQPNVAWCEVPGNPGPPYLQIDFNRQVVITGVATQGKVGDRFVKSYRLAFADNLTSWKIYTDAGGQEKVTNYSNDNNKDNNLQFFVHCFNSSSFSIG